MAAVGKAKKATRTKPKARSTVVVVGKKTHRKVSGTSVGKTHKTTKKRKSKPGFLGATGTTNKVMQIAEMAVGVGIGAAATHMFLRPMEHKLAQKFPAAEKLMGGAEIVLGGMLALWSPKPFVKSIGVGILSGGVHTIMHQLPIGLHSPSVSGATMLETSFPISGDLRETISGLIEDGANKGRYVRTPVVGSILDNHSGAVRTPIVGDYESLDRTPTVSGGGNEMGDLTQEEMDYLYAPRG